MPENSAHDPNLPNQSSGPPTPPSKTNAKPGLRIETVLAKDLYAFYCDFVEHCEGQTTLPISKARALSQSKNPCADKDDVGLLVAYIGDKCVGYQGTLPGWLCTKDGLAKVYWGTGSYVLPEFRKRMVAVQLTRKLISLRKDVVVTYLNKALADVFKGLHFQEMRALDYLTVRVDRLDVFAYPFRRFYRLQKRWPILRKIAEGAIQFSRRVCYPPIRAAYYRSLARRSEGNLKDINWQEVPGGGLSAEDTSAPSHPAPSFERDAEVINWTVEYPWIQSGGTPSSPPYFFSESYDLFRYAILAINDKDGKRRGFVLLSLAVDKGESKLKVLDFRCSREDYKNLFWLICQHAAQFRVDEVEFPLELEAQIRSLPFAFMTTKREQRRYLCYPSSKDSPLASALQDLTLDICDGDYPLT